MTDILCNWLNDEVKLTVRVDPTSFAKEFSTGFLLGEVLHKYQLQDDFDQFSQARTADSKLNNFTRVEPVLHLLEVPFDTNVARDVMTERHGMATRLMYQLFIALNKKQKNNLTGVAMETMRPAAPLKLENAQSLIYKERLKHMTPRQTDLNLEALVDRYHQKQVEMEKVAFKERFEEEERYLQKIQDERAALREKHRMGKAKKSEMLAKIQAATVHIPKPPPNKTAKAVAMRQEHRTQAEAQTVYNEINEFEEKLKRTLPPSQAMGLEVEEVSDLPDPLDLVKPSSNDDYINLIKKRLNEDQSARAEREKRRRKVLVDQLGAHEAQEEARREEMLVNRLMRQSQQERRIAVQLLQARHEKEVICKNRMMREKQYEERRLKEFQEALNMEAEMARLAQEEYAEQTKKDKELHNTIMAERAKEKYTKHYDMCGEILGDIVDFSTKVGEYRELTNRLLPKKKKVPTATLR